MVFAMHPQGIHRHRGADGQSARGTTKEDKVVDCQVYVMHSFKKTLMNLPHLSLYSSYSEEGKPIDLSMEDELSDQLSDNLLQELKEP